MLLKSHRLNLKTSFRWVVQGQSYSSKNFKLFYRLGSNNIPQVGVSIISAQFKKSTLRNQAKRIMFDIAGKNLPLLHKNLNLVIMPRSQVLEVEHSELEQEFKNAISTFKIN